ncbi:hypothetical protein OAF34_06545, partial [Pirellulaceae bacterium]|nr:hypothetical protein [Pirellulaceae bacterium]
SPKIIDGIPVLSVEDLEDSEFGTIGDDVYVNQDNAYSGFEKNWPKEDGDLERQFGTHRTTIKNLGIHRISLQANCEDKSETKNEFIEVESSWTPIVDNNLELWKKINDSFNIQRSGNAFQLGRKNSENELAGLIPDVQLELPIRLNMTYKRVRAGKGAAVRLFGVSVGEPNGADRGERLTLDTSNWAKS